MFGNIITKIKCYMCGEGHKFTKCEICKKIICHDCKTSVFVSGGRKCFWCKIKNKK